MKPVPEVSIEDPIEKLIAAFENPGVRAVPVVTPFGELVGVMSDRDFLGALLPPYILEDASLAGVLEEAAAGSLLDRLEARRVGDLLDASTRQLPVVGPGDTLLEVASVLAETGEPTAVVVEGGRVLGAITLDRLLAALLHPEAT